MINDFIKAFNSYYRNPLKYEFDGVGQGFGLPPEQQLQQLRQRASTLILTSSYKDLDAETHDRAFTVAGVMAADILQDIYNFVEQGKKEGWDLNTFLKKVSQGDLVKKLTDAGWTGANPSRLKLIYDFNSRISSAKLRYQNQLANKYKAPYLVYYQIDRETKDPQHSIFHDKKFRIDDPIVGTIYPPSRPFCGCFMIATDNPDGVMDTGGIKDLTKDMNFEEAFPMSPTKPWQPDFKKYESELANSLEKLLKQRQNLQTLTNPIDLSKIDDLIKEADRILKTSELTKDKFASVLDSLNKIENEFGIAKLGVPSPQISDYNKLVNKYESTIEKAQQLKIKDSNSDMTVN